MSSTREALDAEIRALREIDLSLSELKAKIRTSGRLPLRTYRKLVEEQVELNRRKFDHTEKIRALRAKIQDEWNLAYSASLEDLILDMADAMHAMDEAEEEFDIDDPGYAAAERTLHECEDRLIERAKRIFRERSDRGRSRRAQPSDPGTEQAEVSDAVG